MTGSLVLALSLACVNSHSVTQSPSPSVKMNVVRNLSNVCVSSTVAECVVTNISMGPWPICTSVLTRAEGTRHENCNCKTCPIQFAALKQMSWHYLTEIVQ